ncbi:MAG: YihY/virulence factor BrkB family protein [Vicinamibacterales bacterium]
MANMPVGRRTLALLRDAFGLWSSGNAFQLAGALAFYTLFSLAPLLIILIAIVGAVFGDDAARGQVASQIDGLIGTQAAAAVQEAVRRSRVQDAGLLPSVMGGVALLLGSTTVFAQMQASLNEIWGVMARPSRSGLVVYLWTRLVSLGLVLIIGFLLLTSMVISAAVAAAVQFAQAWLPVPGIVVTTANLGVSLLVATLLFATIFKVLPDVRLRWRDMWHGAAITAVLFVAGQSLISIYLTHAAPASTYGAAGSLVLVLLWVYYSSLILFFGAALTRAAIRLRGDRIVPKATAVRVRIDVLEDVEPG